MGNDQDLRALSTAYARAVDRRDVDGFLAVFDPDATLRISVHGDPDRVAHTIRGHGELAAIPSRVARYERTYHLLGQAQYEQTDADATGEVHCVANHLDRRPDGAVNSIMYIRYADRYRRADDGIWRIVDRFVQVDWTETRPAD
jgi:3-phenylpropionate/cinnamic acid dioxygenase small subunit